MEPVDPDPTTHAGRTAGPGVVGAPDLEAALRDVARLGGFFGLATRAAEGVDPSWRPFAAFTGDVLDARIDQVAEQLGAVPRRIAASLLSLSVSARITGLLLGAGGLHGVVPRLHDRLQWRPWSGGPMPLWLAAPEPAAPEPVAPEPVAPEPVGPGAGAGGPVADLATSVADELERTLTPVLDAVRVQAAVSPQVLWGNVASSLGGALRMLHTERPDATDAVEALAVALTARAPLRGLGEFVDDPTHPTGIAFARRTCCLFYRAPGGGTCGDCVLNPVPEAFRRHPPQSDD